MDSNYARAFKRKLGLRMAEGGPVGLSNISMRDRQIDAAVSAAVSAPTPPPAAAPAPATVASARPAAGMDPAFLEKHGYNPDGSRKEKPSIMQRAKSLLGLRDGGPIFSVDAPRLGDERKTAEQIAREAGFPLAGQGQPPVAVPMTPRRTGSLRDIDAGMVRSDPNAMKVRKPNPAIGVRAARGGPIKGPGGPTDDKINVLASNGEYVLPAKTVDALGVDTLDEVVMATNDGKFPHGSRKHRGLREGGLIALEDFSDPANRPVRVVNNPAGNVVHVTPSGTAATTAQLDDLARGQAIRAQNARPSYASFQRGERVANAAKTVGKYGRLGLAAAPVIGAATTVLEGDKGVDQMTEGTFGGRATGPARAAAYGVRALQNTGDAASFGVAGKLGSAIGLTLAGGSPLDAFDDSIPGAPPAASLTATPAPSGRVVGPNDPDANDTRNTLRGSFARPAAPVQPAPDRREAELSAAIDAATSRDPTRGAGGNFYTGRYASNVAGVLQDRARAKLLLDKYKTDSVNEASQANSRRTAQTAANQLAATNAEKAAARVKESVDRLATVQTVHKDGTPSGTTLDPAQRNRIEAYARNSVKGWDNLSPEEQTAAIEGKVRHGVMLNDLAQSDEHNLLGRIMRATGLADELGGQTDTPVGVKAVRELGVGDLKNKNASVLSLAAGTPFVEFDNGRLARLQDVMANPELRNAFETRLKMDPNKARSAEVRKQLKKYAGGK